MFFPIGVACTVVGVLTLMGKKPGAIGKAKEEVEAEEGAGDGTSDAAADVSVKDPEGAATPAVALTTMPGDHDGELLADDRSRLDSEATAESLSAAVLASAAVGGSAVPPATRRGVSEPATSRRPAHPLRHAPQPLQVEVQRGMQAEMEEVTLERGTQSVVIEAKRGDSQQVIALAHGVQVVLRDGIAADGRWQVTAQISSGAAVLSCVIREGGPQPAAAPDRPAVRVEPALASADQADDEAAAGAGQGAAADTALSLAPDDEERSASPVSAGQRRDSERDDGSGE